MQNHHYHPGSRRKLSSFHFCVSFSFTFAATVLPDGAKSSVKRPRRLYLAAVFFPSKTPTHDPKFRKRWCKTVTLPNYAGYFWNGDAHGAHHLSTWRVTSRVGRHEAASMVGNETQPLLFPLYAGKEAETAGFLEKKITTLKKIEISISSLSDTLRPVG